MSAPRARHPPEKLPVARATLLCLLILSVRPVVAQQAGTTDLAEGQSLIARLAGGIAPVPAADQALFQQIGIDQSQKVLMAVVSNGSAPAATADDWKQMHHALDALIELNVGQQQLLKASIFASLQDAAYRNHEADYIAALSAAREALDLQERSGQTLTLNIPWNNIGEDLIHLDRLDEAADDFYQARKLTTDPTTSLGADLWRKIITLELSRGNAEVAHTESQAFLAAATPSTPAAFRAEAQLAASQVDIAGQHYDDAIAHIHLSLAVIKTDPNPLVIAYQAIDTLLSLGLEAMESMPYDQALVICEQIDKGFPGLPISVSGFGREVGNHRRLLAGQFDQVLRDDGQQLDRARATNDLAGQVSALLMTAVDYSYLRESTQQIAALQQALDILHSPPGAAITPLLRFRILERLATAQVDHGDLSPARANYAEVIAGVEAVTSAQMRSQLGDLYAASQLGIASVMEREGSFKGAREILHNALNPAPGAWGRSTRSTVLLQQARLEQSAKQSPDVVASLYIDAIAALHQDKDLNSEVSARMQFVQYLATEGRAAASSDKTAREQLALARMASTSVGLADSTWRIQFLEGILNQNAGDTAAASKSYSAAVDALDHIRAGLSQEEERQSFIDSASVQELYRRQVQLLTVANNRELAWEFLERDKARSFLETLHGRRFAQAIPAKTIATGKPPAEPRSTQLAELEQQIVTARLALSPQSEGTLRNSGQLPEVTRARLVSLEKSFVLAREQQQLNTSRSTQPLSLKPITLAATQTHLPAGTALIEYAILDHELAAFIVTHTSSTELQWEADTAALPAQMAKLADLLASARASEDALDAQTSAASKILLAPVLPALPADIDTLLIVPTQSLSLIPFQALPIPEPASSNRGFAAEAVPEDLAPRTQLIDRFAVAYLPSASTLEFLHFGPSSASPDLFLGAIGDLSVEGLPPLPGTLDETAAIQKLYPHASRITGAAFTHQAAVDALLQHQEVHFATHGLFESQAPLFSAIVTAPSAGQPTRLTLYEVMDLNLKARLVILSACETDRGQMSGGDEVEGLTRTFLQAGADNVVSSLWQVNARLGNVFPCEIRRAEPRAM